MLLLRPDADADAYDVPDRRTGRQGLAELRRLNSHRRWNFVEVVTSHYSLYGCLSIDIDICLIYMKFGFNYCAV